MVDMRSQLARDNRARVDRRTLKVVLNSSSVSPSAITPIKVSPRAVSPRTCSLREAPSRTASPWKVSFGPVSLAASVSAVASLQPASGEPVTLLINGIAADATEREVHVLFSGCLGYYGCAVVHDGDCEAGAARRSHALVYFATGESAAAALQARVGTTWTSDAPPVTISILGAMVDERSSPGSERLLSFEGDVAAVSSTGLSTSSGSAGFAVSNDVAALAASRGAKEAARRRQIQTFMKAARRMGCADGAVAEERRRIYAKYLRRAEVDVDGCDAVRMKSAAFARSASAPCEGAVDEACSQSGLAVSKLGRAASSTLDESTLGNEHANAAFAHTGWESLVGLMLCVPKKKLRGWEMRWAILCNRWCARTKATAWEEALGIFEPEFRTVSIRRSMLEKANEAQEDNTLFQTTQALEIMSVLVQH